MAQAGVAQGDTHPAVGDQFRIMSHADTHERRQIVPLSLTFVVLNSVCLVGFLFFGFFFLFFPVSFNIFLVTLLALLSLILDSLFELYC